LFQKPTFRISIIVEFWRHSQESDRQTINGIQALNSFSYGTKGL